MSMFNQINPQLATIVMFRDEVNQFIIPNNATMCLNPETGEWVDFEYIQSKLWKINLSLKNTRVQSAAGEITVDINNGYNDKDWSIAFINTKLAKIREFFILQENEEVTDEEVTAVMRDNREMLPDHKNGQNLGDWWDECRDRVRAMRKEAKSVEVTSLTKVMEDIVKVKKEIAEHEQSLVFKQNQLAKLKAMLVNLV